MRTARPSVVVPSYPFVLTAMLLVVGGPVVLPGHGTSSTSPSAAVALSWSRTSITGPPATELGSVSLAYSPPDRGLLLVSTDDLEAHSYTWLLHGGRWTDLSSRSPVAPVGRVGPGFVYDAADGYMLLFGGAAASGVLNDTWEFKNHSWSPIRTPVAPPPLYPFAMTYDARDGEVLLFGGCCLNAFGLFSNETWSYHQGTWHRIVGSPAPAQRYDPSLAYDAIDAEVVMYGGTRSYLTGLNTTWSFHGGTWHHLTGRHLTPGDLDAPGVAYDGALGEVVLVGGYWGSRTSYTTWAFDDGSWTNMTSTVHGRPPACLSGEMAYDPSARELVILDAGGHLWTLT